MQIKWLLLVIVWMCIVPERALQDWHATSLQDLQLQESHLLRPLRQLAVGPVQTRPQVWRWVHTTFIFGMRSRSYVVYTPLINVAIFDCVLPFFKRTDCGMNVHSNCQKKVANLCGINQKLLAEALSQVSQVCTAPCSVNFSECKWRRNSVIFHFCVFSAYVVSIFVFFYFFFKEIYQEVWRL